ncbi:hypothetical protein TrispH2_009503 [Trichoplax sp. H2]|nr:hypothetical protein TrispH2_009503 [Trichoplax sp. H2]|eukprot:RDD38617.1 hypothetical protein TrispH2_009503 [Trichoplax sp. H2]
MVSQAKRKQFLPFHRFFGAAAYLTSLVSVSTGAFDHLVLFYQNYSDIGLAPRMGNTMAILVIIVGFLAGYLLVNRSFKSSPPKPPTYNPGVF